MKSQQPTYAKNEVTAWPVPNYWDVIVLLLVLAVIVLLGFAAKDMLGHFTLGETTPISLSPWMLPYYALRTVLRMFIAMFFSLLFTFIFATWAAKNRQAERIIIPAIDILQSVPVLGFLTITISGFIMLFQGSWLGPECAAIFVIFVAQVWNMALSFYQSLRTVPKDLREVAVMLQLSAWQRFWRLEVPFAMPGLLWNAMMSMSGSWVFLVAAEAISVAKQHILLPGMGSYISVAIDHRDIQAIIYVIVAMLVVITLYDQLLFRPLVAWVEKFKMGMGASDLEAESWLLNLFQRTQFLRFIGRVLSYGSDMVVNGRWLRRRPTPRRQMHSLHWLNRSAVWLWHLLWVCLLVMALIILMQFILTAVTWLEIKHVIYLGSVTALRVLVLIVVSSVIWLPIGVWVGLRPRVSSIVQPLAQFFASFPANLLFPVVVIAILHFHLNVNIWVSPLMILGTQWYILFNVIAGTMALPRNLQHAACTLNVRGWLWWRRLILPGIFPYYITGAITAAGGAWNISILAEAVSWGNTHLQATGLGAYITEVSTQGDFRRLALGIVVMSLYVLLLNRLLWRPLYHLAESRYQI